MGCCGKPSSCAPVGQLVEKINNIEQFQRERQIGNSNQKDWPAQEIIGTLAPQVKVVMNAIGIRGAYISDLTMVGDFEGVDISKVAAELGLDGLTGREYIWELAQRLKANSQ